MTVLIKLTIAGTNTGPFNLYSNLDGYVTPFASNISKTVLVSGFSSNTVPDNTLIIRAKSLGVCKNFIDIQVVDAITTTTSSSSTTSTTSTTTTTTTVHYMYTGNYYSCVDCELGPHVDIINAEPLTITSPASHFYDSTTGYRVKVITFDGTTTAPVNTHILNSSQHVNCVDVPCPGLVAYHFAETGSTVVGTACAQIDFDNVLYSSDFPLTNGFPPSRLYSDATLTIPYTPPSSFWYSVRGLNEVIFMSTTPPDQGTVLNIFGCPVTTTTTTT